MPDFYVTGAFKSEIKDQAYIFMKSEYVKEDYAPTGATVDKILYGPARVSDFHSLRNTIFSDGIDCAFGSHDLGEAYIFSWNNCAKWVYPSDTRIAELIKGPITIAEMFPFLKETVFENGVDAAFESSIKYEAYLFKGDQYARIYYGPNNPRLILSLPLIKGWPCFEGTIFENGCFDAALASHIEKEAFIFKGDSYVRLYFTPGETKDRIGPVYKLKDGWKDLGDILPRKWRNVN